MQSRKNKLMLLGAVTLLGCISMLFVPRIAQSQDYHQFSDTRQLASIPNFYNVVTNVLFLVFGSMGIFISLYFRQKEDKNNHTVADLFFFSGIFMTGLGSAYYHLYPGNETLVWDRLPMTIAFMAFFSVIISEYIDLRTGKRFLFHLLFLGIFSVIYWLKTEQSGHGDLRLYALVQFLPMILVPLILVLFRSGSSYSGYYWIILAVYLLAKIFEHYDREIFLSTRIVSGHSLKHLAASVVPLIYFMKVWAHKTSGIHKTS